MSCEDCIHSEVCDMPIITDGRKNADNCGKFKNKSDYAEIAKVSEQIIRKNADVINYWRKDVTSYRATKGYSDIEHDTDNFLRGYNEAVDDMLAIFDGKGDT